MPVFGILAGIDGNSSVAEGCVYSVLKQSLC
jgi:hypothetical protein